MRFFLSRFFLGTLIAFSYNPIYGADMTPNSTPDIVSDIISYSPPLTEEISHPVPFTASQPVPKEYLVVMLHGIDGDKEKMASLMPLVAQSYQTFHTPEDMTKLAEKIDFLMPTALNNQWFQVPDSFAVSRIVFDVVWRNHTATDKLVGFRENLTNLRSQIDTRLNELNLGYDRLILTGVSQGAIAALTLAFESPLPVQAVVSASGVWMPCQIKSIPNHIIFTNGEKDELISQTVINKVNDVFDQRLKEAMLKQRKTINIQRILFPEDGHDISLKQLNSILSFLDGNVFSNPPLPSGKKLIIEDPVNEEDKNAISSTSSSEENSEEDMSPDQGMPHEEMMLLLSAFDKMCAPFMNK